MREKTIFDKWAAAMRREFALSAEVEALRRELAVCRNVLTLSRAITSHLRREVAELRGGCGGPWGCPLKLAAPARN